MGDGGWEGKTKNPHTTPVQPLSYPYAPPRYVSCTVYCVY